MDKEALQEVKNLINNLPEKFNLLEQGVDLETRKEYFKIYKKINTKNYLEAEIIEESNKLFSPEIDLNIKREILIKLASLGTVKSYRKIEKYYNDSIDKDLVNWTLLALEDCKMFLESYLMDEDIGFISTGLGSKRNKLRNFFIIIALDDNKFKKTEREIINREYELVCKEFDSELEKIEFDANYSSLTVLLPMNIAYQKL
mgnify:CR=1 FL=1